MRVMLAEKHTKKTVLLLLCLVTLALYARTAWYPFSSNDDQEYVAQNVHVLGGLTLDGLRWAFSSFYAANWHPLTWLSLMLDAQLFGASPAGFHLHNLLLHVANALLLCLLLERLTGAFWRSALVAALFAWHPLHVESVAWVTERKDVLSTLFWLLTLLFYAGYVRGRKACYLLALGAFALGLLAKPMLVTLPVVLLLMDYWPLGRWARAGEGGAAPLRLVAEKLPFALLSAAVSVVTILAQRQTVAGIRELPLSMRVGNALWSAFAYAEKTLVPSGLAAYYPLVPVPPWKPALAALLLAGCVLSALRVRSRAPYLAWGLGWYLVTLIPVIGLVQVGGQAMADRYSYLPSIGLCVALSWGGAELASRFPRWSGALAATAGCALAAYLALAWLQVGYWRDDLALFEHTLAVTGENTFAHNMLGIAYANRGEGERAVAEYSLALAGNPDDPGTHRNLGLVLDRQLGRPAEALSHYQVAAALDPSDPFAHYHAGKALMNLGRPAEAAREYGQALALRPDDPYFHNDLGMALLQAQAFDQAVAQLGEAVRLSPSFGQAASNLQYALRLRDGRPALTTPAGR